MSVILNGGEKILVQGITGRQGRFHTRRMLEYGSLVVGGVSPGKGGTKVEGLAVFDTVKEAVALTGAEVSCLFVPAPGATDAAHEAMESGVRLLVLITEHIPVHDCLKIMARAEELGVRVVGPNTFGVISPGKGKVGIMPHEYYMPGPVGIASRSGTLSYQVAAELSAAGLGQSTAVGVGGDPVTGLTLGELVKAFGADGATEALVLIGEIGGTAEEEAAELIGGLGKPVVAYLVGRTAPAGVRMGHAGAIIEGNRGTYQSKVAALEAAGAVVAETPWEVASLVKRALGRV